MSSSIVWFEVIGADAERSRAFYSEVLGWAFKDEAMPPRDYRLVDTAEGGVPGGIGHTLGDEPGWSAFYVSVDDVDAAIASALARGGALRMPPVDLPNLRIAVIADPDGHAIGLAQSTAAA